MFQQLLESNAVFHPRVGGSLASTVGHVAAIAAAVVFTARQPAPLEPPLERTTYVAPASPPEPSIQRAPAPSATIPEPRVCLASCVVTPPLVLVSMPVGLPDIDFTASSVRDPQFGNSTVAIRGDVSGAALNEPGGGRDRAWLDNQVDRRVILLPGSPAPIFPDALRAAGVSGGVMAEFVVDTLGRIEAASISLLWVDHDQFGAAVRAVLPRMKFMPAEAQGRKVRQLVRLPFRFDLHDLMGNSNLGLI